MQLPNKTTPQSAALTCPKADRTRSADTGEPLLFSTAESGKVLFDDGSLKAEFLAPIGDSYANLNNASAVLMLTYRSNRFLFMGDAEGEVEEKILESGCDVSADVLKAGHHGSDTSSTRSFLEAVKPSFAVISVGNTTAMAIPLPPHWRRSIILVRTFGAQTKKGPSL